eukprot:scaffold10215_cov32-Tisochrysis_lutea.AAC.6
MLHVRALRCGHENNLGYEYRRLVDYETASGRLFIAADGRKGEDSEARWPGLFLLGRCRGGERGHLCKRPQPHVPGLFSTESSYEQGVISNFSDCS